MKFFTGRTLSNGRQDQSHHFAHLSNEFLDGHDNMQVSECILSTYVCVCVCVCACVCVCVCVCVRVRAHAFYGTSLLGKFLIPPYYLCTVLLKTQKEFKVRAYLL